MKRFELKTVGLAGLVALAAVGTSLAQSNDSLAQRIDALDQQIRVVARLNEIAQEDAKAAAAKQGKVLADEKGLGVSSADGAFSLKLKGFVQTSGLYFIGNGAVNSTTANPNVTSVGPALNNFTVRRLYSDLNGTAYKNFDYRAQVDFAAGTATVLDANLDWRLLPEFNLRVGKFKPPTGLERLLSAPRSPFIEGSFVTLLQPNRDLGFQFFGDVGKGLGEYQIGFFDGARDGLNNTGDNNDDKDVYARVFTTPFAHGDVEALTGLGLGISGSYGHQDQYTGALPAYALGTGRQTFFAYAAQDTSSGSVTRYSPQAYYYFGPFGLIAEYTATKQNVRRAAFNEDLTNSAWSVTASYFLTGEKNAYKSIKVKKANTFPSIDGIGALELIGRVQGLKVDDKAFDSLAVNSGVRYADPAKNASAAIGYDAAIGWYLNNSVKIFASYEYTAFTGGAGASANTAGTAGPIVKDRDAEQVVSVSFNVAY